MALKKKAAAKKKAAPKPREPEVVASVFYRSPDGRDLYRVEATKITLAGPNQPQDGWDLTDVPPGAVGKWNGSVWAPATLPPVGKGEGAVRHTTNAARVGV